MIAFLIILLVSVLAYISYASSKVLNILEIAGKLNHLANVNMRLYNECLIVDCGLTIREGKNRVINLIKPYVTNKTIQKQLIDYTDEQENINNSKTCCQETIDITLTDLNIIRQELLDMKKQLKSILIPTKDVEDILDEQIKDIDEFITKKDQNDENSNPEV